MPVGGRSWITTLTVSQLTHGSRLGSCMLLHSVKIKGETAMTSRVEQANGTLAGGVSLA